MRTVAEIRDEMATSAQMAGVSLEVGAEEAAIRHAAWYQALAWVLQEPWVNGGADGD